MKNKQTKQINNKKQQKKTNKQKALKTQDIQRLISCFSYFIFHSERHTL